MYKLCLFLLFISLSKIGISQIDSVKDIIDTSTLAPEPLDILQPEWVYITESKHNDKFYIKNTYENKEDKKIQIWVKSEITSFTFSNKIYKNVEIKDLTIFDCDMRRYETVFSICYSSSGNVIYQDDYNHGWEIVIPDTVFEIVFTNVCEKYNY